MKKKGVLSPNQSQFLGGVFQSPLITVYPQARETILNAYLQTTDDTDRPEDLDDDVKISVNYAIATAEKADEFDDDADPEDIVRATESPYKLEEDVIDPTQ